MSTPETSSVTLLLLLVALTVKHFIADYPLQTKYMLKKTNAKDWQLPLLSHTLVHGGLTTVIFLFVVGFPAALIFGFLDWLIHLVVDLWKARFTRHYNQFQKKFWTALGFDQMLHQLTYIALAFIVYRLHTWGV